MVPTKLGVSLTQVSMPFGFSTLTSPDFPAEWYPRSNDLILETENPL